MLSWILVRTKLLVLMAFLWIFGNLVRIFQRKKLWGFLRTLMSKVGLLKALMPIF